MKDIHRRSHTGGLVYYIHHQLGLPIASTAPLAKISDRSAVYRFAFDQDVPWVNFVKGQRKDDVMHEHLGRFAVNGGSIWLFGGEHDGEQVTDVQRVDLSTGRGSVAGHLLGPLSHAGAFTLGGEVFVAGGRTGATATDAVLRFDPRKVTFTTAGHLPVARSDVGVGVVGGTAYLVGGENPGPVDTVILVRAQGAPAQ